MQSSGVDLEENEAAKALVDRVLEDSLLGLEKEDQGDDMFVRWELGACWVQHLQTQAAAEKAEKKSTESNKENKDEKKKNLTVADADKQSVTEMNIEQPQTEVFQLQGDDNDITTTTETNDDNAELQKLLSKVAYNRLKDTETSLHSKVYSCSCKVAFFLNCFVYFC